MVRNDHIQRQVIRIDQPQKSLQAEEERKVNLFSNAVNTIKNSIISHIALENWPDAFVYVKLNFYFSRKKNIGLAGRHCAKQANNPNKTLY